MDIIQQLLAPLILLPLMFVVGLQLTPSWPLQDDPKLLADAEAVSAASQSDNTPHE